MDVEDIIRGLGLALLLAVSALLPLKALAQPTVISPEDVARSAQLNTVIDDFSHTPAYDLKHPMELAVTLQHVHLPKDGYAQIVFTVNALGEGAEAHRLAPDKRYLGTLQTTRNVNKLKLNKKELEGGVPAILLAWPATDWNQTPSDFLVDEIQLVESGKWIGFHSPHDNMVKHRKSKGEGLSPN